MIWISTEALLALHETVVEQSGGTNGVRDTSLLDSAVNAPLAGFGGVEIYPTLKQKAVRLCYGIIANHPFVDGNKRTGTAALLLILKANGVSFRPSHTELIRVIQAVAAGTCSESALLRWVEQST